MKKIFITLLCIVILTACTPSTDLPVRATEPPVTVTATATVAPAPMPEALWVSPAVPADLVDFAKSLNIPATDDLALATHKLDVADSGSLWIYALVAPFPTVADDVTFADLSSSWKGAPAGPFGGHALLLAQSTLDALTALWGKPASGAVRVVSSDQLLDTAWAEMPAWAIIPFEEVEPKWKVLSVDGQSPIHKDFKADLYPLKVNFGLSNPGSITLPKSNRDASKLATVVLTGVTALVRATALTMELKGVNYPGSLIRDWLREADIAHISNEVTFDSTCPYPKEGYTNLILCSDPKYMALLQDVGTDIVELSGDHLLDRGGQALLNTLAMYKEDNLPYYGGGLNAEDARRPVLLEVNGNKLAFMGCNGKPANFPKATSTTPGPAECDYKFFDDQIRTLTAQGYMVIFTFQHNECYSPTPCYMHEEGFHSVADAGAVVVSGSQAHFPHIMEFRGKSFIHYGLGNFFFDQMRYFLPDGTSTDGTRREFIDRHVFYGGHYLGMELLTAMLEDYSRPRPMNTAERTAFLTEYFNLSGWTPFSPTPIPQPTVTLTPIALP
jgi:Bacterial capsule synthesis protein PGA_cap